MLKDKMLYSIFPCKRSFKSAVKENFQHIYGLAVS